MKPGVTLDGRRIEISSGEALLRRLEKLTGRRFLEVWVERKPETMSMLANADRAWLMYLREGEVCFRSCDPQGAHDDGMMECRLADGQRDACPRDWTVPRATACLAMASFLDHGGRPETIAWRDETDSFPGRRPRRPAAPDPTD